MSIIPIRAPGPLVSCTLEADNGAELHAKYSEDHDGFKVGLTGCMTDRTHGTTWWAFDAPACREAATFFTQLAADLDNREGH